MRIFSTLSFTNLLITFDTPKLISLQGNLIINYFMKENSIAERAKSSSVDNRFSRFHILFEFKIKRQSITFFYSYRASFTERWIGMHSHIAIRSFQLFIVHRQRFQCSFRRIFPHFDDGTANHAKRESEIVN